MVYKEALDKIESLLVFGSRPGLDRIRKLLGMINDPQNSLRFIHVAGTNGKGSVCNMLASILKESGYRTGLFTSPHITCFGERMQINGEYIPESDVVSLVEKLFPFVEKMRSEGEIITEFEFVTAMAFCWFKEKSCDSVVLETGMGGRFDSTNVITTPLCSVITSISLDHTAVLGETLSAIAGEKCGIIKQNGTTVFLPQEQEVNDRVAEAAKEMNNFLVTPPVPKLVSTELSGTIAELNGITVKLPLLGRHQMNNLSLVLAAVDVLRSSGFKISDDNLKKGLESVRFPARFEILSRSPLVILDGAHNPGGMRALSCAIDEYLSDRQIICVLGMLRDKDCVRAAANLEGKVKKVYAAAVPDSPRSQTAEELKTTLGGLNLDIEPCGQPERALELALDEAAKTENSALLICGSLYLGAALRKYYLDNI